MFVYPLMPSVDNFSYEGDSLCRGEPAASKRKTQLRTDSQGKRERSKIKLCSVARLMDRVFFMEITVYV